MEFICEKEEDLSSVAEKIVEIGGEEKIWLFIGEMGAGKTALIKKLGDYFQFEDSVSSPSFAIVNEYADFGSNVYYHFDFYRLKNEAEAMDIGVEEYFYSGNYCFIEWPEKVSNLLPENYLLIEIKNESGNTRTINVKHHD